MYLADQAYTIEVSVYELIPRHFQGSIVPEYLGS